MSKISIVVLLIMCIISTSNADLFTVAQDGTGRFSSIQAAVDAAGVDDTVMILDDAVYEEQVDIGPDQKGLLLTSVDPVSADKPTIKYHDKVHVHPVSYEEALNEVIDYDQNGALRVLSAKKITIDGLRIDGDSAFVFGAEAIWEGIYGLQHGNGGIVIYNSGAVTIRNCDIYNTYIGIYVKDRNGGGVFANESPDEADPSSVVPLSAFGQTGNHLFEKNRIHHNSFGMYWEAIWDLGSTIRHNLFYENHHPTEEFAEMVEELTYSGRDYPGGALWFKDHLLSPLAIYNNTFWHNTYTLGGPWRAGAQHLVFNNIFSTPNKYLRRLMSGPIFELGNLFTHRMYNCIYACQSDTPSVFQRTFTASQFDSRDYPGIQADSVVAFYGRLFVVGSDNYRNVQETGFDVDIVLPLPQGDSTVTAGYVATVLPGASINGIFPDDARVRWLETDYHSEISTAFSTDSFHLFQSTEIGEPGFLEPDWNHTQVKQFIQDQGFENTGIRDADKSPADLGALPAGGIPDGAACITPITPVVIENTKATIHFVLSSNNSLSNYEIRHMRFIKDVKYQDETYGQYYEPIGQEDVIDLSVSSTIREGVNSLSLTIPPLGEDERYGYIEMIIEAENESNEPVPAVGFIPYRKPDYPVHVQLFDRDENRVDTVTVGDTATLRVSIDTTLQVSPFILNFSSGAPLYTSDEEQLVIDTLDSIVSVPIVFTQVPEGGIDFICAAGRRKVGYFDPQNFYGQSEVVTVLPHSTNDKKPVKSIEYVAKPGNTHYTVYAPNGRMVFSETASSYEHFRKAFAGRKLGRGVYVVRMHTPGGSIKSPRRVVAVK